MRYDQGHAGELRRMDLETKPVTLIFLLYNSEETVAALVEAARKQRHPRYTDQADWLDVVFIDDGSRDGTLAHLHAALKEAGFPPHFKVVANGKNLGLSGSLNKAFGLIGTPYGLTCHVDVLFGREDYVAEMLSLMETHPDAGAITGQPQISPGAQIQTAEKLNLICNLMDVFPPEGDVELVPVGFAEGRCDIFRVESLEKAGFWDTTLRASGEDQILAARMRQNGYEIYQAPKLTYYLSVSNEQNSIGKLLRHAHLFGRTQPYILLSNNRALTGITRAGAVSNRRARAILRLTHVLGAAAYLFVPVWLGSNMPSWISISPLLAVVFAKGWLFRSHLAVARLTISEWLLLFIFAPLQDICYTSGLIQGIWNYYHKSKRGTIIK